MYGTILNMLVLVARCALVMATISQAKLDVCLDTPLLASGMIRREGTEGSGSMHICDGIKLQAPSLTQTSIIPSQRPSTLPSVAPSQTPSTLPSDVPSQSTLPSVVPSQTPSTVPSFAPYDITLLNDFDAEITSIGVGDNVVIIGLADKKVKFRDFNGNDFPITINNFTLLDMDLNVNNDIDQVDPQIAVSPDKSFALSLIHISEPTRPR